MGTKMRGTWKEDAEEKKARLDFEASHPFRKGDKVIIVDGTIYTGISIVVRDATLPETGACIRIFNGGVEFNIFDPNEDLCFATKIGELLYA